MHNVKLAIFAATLITFGAAQAQPFPVKSIRIVVPFAHGSGIDVTMRAISAEMTKSLGQSVYVENRGGAGGIIGTQEVARAAPDGYTLLAGTNGTQVVNPLIKKALPYDAIKDFTPLVLATESPMFVTVNPKLGVTSLAQLVQLAKRKPVTFASAGPAHSLAIEYLGLRAGVKFSVIPYKGAAPAQVDTVAGHVDAYLDTGLAVFPLASAGKLKILAGTSLNRISSLPDVPTVAETYQGYQATANVALFAPARTPPQVVARLTQEIQKVLALPSIQKVVVDGAAIPLNGNGAAVEKWLNESRDLWSDVIAKTGVVLE